MLHYSQGVFKNGAVLFFGKQPQKIFDIAVIRCVAFDGDSKTHIIDDKTFGGAPFNIRLICAYVYGRADWFGH